MQFPSDLSPRLPPRSKNWNDEAGTDFSSSSSSPDTTSDSSSAISRSTFRATSHTKLPFQPTPDEEMRKWRYPRNHSFIVEMNHAPDYGHEKAIDNAPEEVGAPQSPVYENSSKAIQSTDLSKTSPQKPSDPAKSKAEVNPSYAVKPKETIYYPPNSPLNPKQQQQPLQKKPGAKVTSYAPIRIGNENPKFGKKNWKKFWMALKITGAILWISLLIVSVLLDIQRLQERRENKKIIDNYGSWLNNISTSIDNVSSRIVDNKSELKNGFSALTDNLDPYAHNSGPNLVNHVEHNVATQLVNPQIPNDQPANH